MKKIVSIILMATIMASCSCNSKKSSASEAGAESKEITSESKEMASETKADSTPIAKIKLSDLPEEPIFDIETNLGTIRIKLYARTPAHRENFSRLALENFFDSTRFHRIIEGFMIQGGDPLTKDLSAIDEWGTGGPGYTVRAEILPEIHHKRGSVAAARLGDMANPKRASSGSQFYIAQTDEGCSHLDGAYTVFGETIDGFDTLDKIAGAVVDFRDRPIDDVVILRVVPVLE